MPTPMDFPSDPVVGQRYTSSYGVTYEWDGVAWVVGFLDTPTDDFTVVGDIVSQVRIILQDNDAAGYRYSTESIVLNLNQGLVEMFRIRPDIFLATNFLRPRYNSATLDADIGIEEQWIPSLVYYAVGMTQIRDDEGTQDTRASAFLTKFTSTLVAVA